MPQYHMINPQVLGIPTDAQRARIAAGEKLTRIWQGEMPQVFANMKGDPSAWAKGIADGLPGMRLMRVPFSRYFFDENGEFLPDHMQALRRLQQEGFAFLWVLMDGPSQEMGKPDLLKQWPDSYRDVATVNDWLAVFPYLEDRHAEAFGLLLDWLDRHPDFKGDVLHGFEAINEPASYRRAQRSGAVLQTRAFTAYVDAVAKIRSRIDLALPEGGFKFYIGGWGYSGMFDPLAIAQYDHRTCLQALRDIGGDALVWSVHLYPQWVSKKLVHPTEVGAWMDRRFRTILRDDIVFTEYNYQNTRVNAPEVDGAAKATFLQARNQNWFADNEVGIGYWPIVNYAGGFVYRVVPLKQDGVFTGEHYTLKLDHQNSLAHALASFAFGNNPDWCSQGSGEIETLRFTSLHVSNANSDEEMALWDEGALPDDPNGYFDEVSHFTLGFGAAGAHMIAGDDDANNFLVAGDGRAVLYGGDADNHLFLGRGGGVARLQQDSLFNQIVVNGGQNTVYAAGMFCEVSLFFGATDLVVQGDVKVYGFDPEKADRISFAGAFGSAADMRAASRSLPSPYGLRGDTDLEITLPDRTVCLLVGQGAMIDTLAGFNRDLQDGWYRTGWQEPADFD